MAALLVGLLFSSLDTSIVATSLVTISHELGDFASAPWIILAYLLTYMGFAVCFSKLSDIYGRRNMLILSWIIFIAFSMGCATSKGMIMLAFQGIGASGLYSLTQIGLIEVGPVHRPSLIGAMIGATLAAAFVMGPLVGGVISQLSDWRWLFNLNIPFGLITILILTNFWPHEDAADLLSWTAFKSIDFLGSATLLCGSGFLVFAMQQAGSQTLAWQSPAIVISFTLSILTCIVFVTWELHLSRKRHRHIEPIFPIGLMGKRVYAAALLVTLFTGFPYICFSIILPERFQMVNNQNALMAGVRILPMLSACAVGSFLGGAISSKRNNTSYTLVAASCLQLLGVGLMTTVSGDSEAAAAQYGYQAIFGLGVGLSFSAATIMTNILATEPNERASAQGAVAQARVLGGCIGLSLCTIIFNTHANSLLTGRLTDRELDMLHRSPLSGLQLPGNLRMLVREVYIGAFGREIEVIGLACAVTVIISLFTLEKSPTPIERITAPVKDESSSYRRGSDSGTEINDVAHARQMA
ncbi:Major facilitator superfamily domain, general substrate transporter [Metarhizium album ARSEF 1941]|uniref:Major facilitator superfamily domain, general substrate transporter n=1 Tax=Metarhizium album (strain ARSEF 1941) TaxID=1081103 RepID=A0A0B2WLC5_METAS|nr:Major facilitator superfamily domain, general substrate transporter [Metarhizium album ARSEF 1941]KHN94262.1 Major facilitator superfamily domain, general substrate transporter [Metarhizium album ARSEF 1941]